MSSISATAQLFGMTILLICILLFRFLLHQEKKRFLLLIMVLYIVSFILSLLHYIRDGLGILTEVLEYVTYFFWIASVLFLYLSITAYFEKKVNPRILAGLGVTLIWIIIAPFLGFDYFGTTLPLLAGLSGYLLYAGILFIKQETPTTRAGRIVTGITLILFGIENFFRSFVPDNSWLMNWSYFFETICQLIITIGISFIYFEQKEYLIQKHSDDLEIAVEERTKELEISQNRFRQVFEQTPNSIFWTDIETGKIINCNHAAEKLLGYPREEIIGVNFQKFHPPERREEYLTIFKQWVKQQDLTEEIVEVLTKDGDIIPVEINASVVFCNDEYIIQAVFRDIRKRKEMEAERDKMVSLVNNSSDFIGLGTLDGKVLYINQAGCDLIGIHQDEALKYNSFSFVPLEERPRLNDIVLPALQKEGHWSGEAMIQNMKTQRRITVFLNIFMVTDPHTAAPVCIGSVMKDITSWKDSQKELEISEKRLWSLLNAITESAFLMAPDGTVLLANQTVAQRLNVPLEKLVGSNIFSWLPEEVAETRKVKIDKVIKNKEIVRIEDVRFGRTIDSIIYPVLNEQNEITALTVIGRDITEEKEAESLNNLQRKITDTLSIVDDIRKGASTLLKILSELECIGWGGIYLASENGIDCIAQKKIRTIPMEEASFYAKMALDRLQGENVSYLYCTYEELTTIQHESSHESNYPPMAFYHIAATDEATILLQLEAQDASGFPIQTKRLMEQLMIQLTEIFSRMLIKFRLKSSEARFSAVINSMDDIIFTLGKDMSFTGIYGKWTGKWGVEKESLIGKHPAEVFGSKDLILHEDAYKIALMGENTMYDWNAEIDNSERAFQTLLTPLIEEDGTISGVVGVGRDITRNKMIESRIKKYTDELERSNKELEQFAYITSHDLKEPLRTITNFIQLLEYKYNEALDERGKGYISRVVNGAKRMEQMISDLLVYSRVTTHGQPFTKVELESVFKNALENLQITIERKEAVVTAESLIGIVGDEIQLVRLLQNLVSNAIKYCEDNRIPRIHIAMDESPDSWIFSIKDNGIGIPMDQKERIFQIFQRLHTREKYSGTGIGLAVCKRIVERHGGRIWVESEEGEGSTFFFTISKKLPLLGDQHG